MAEASETPAMSPLHARVMWLFDKLQEKHTRIWMDNLYISAKFAKACYKHKKKVLIAGVARKACRGVPLSVVQEEVIKPADQLKVRGTTKAAVLEGDIECPNLVAVSVYDTKPVHFLTTIVEEIQWVSKTKKVWCDAEKRMEKLEFLRLNVNNDYNKDMNAVDIADQLRGNYRFDHWFRNYKWWWSIFLWGFGVLMVNAYKSYTSLMDQPNVPKSERLTHYEFRLHVARAWIDLNGDDRIKAWRAERCHVHTPQDGTNSVNDGVIRNRSTRATPVLQQQLFGRAARQSAIDSIMESPQKKSPQLSDASLSKNGKLKKRLDYFECKHLPKSAEAAGKPCAKCALHRWALGRDGELRRQILVCRDCNVSLCVDCYDVFHSVADLTAHKKELKASLTANAENKSPKKNAKGHRKRASPAKKKRPAGAKRARK